MDTTQYIISLNNLYRVYQKNLPKEDYDYISDLIEHYTSKKNINKTEAIDIDNKCKSEWKTFLLKFIINLEGKIKKFKDILIEEEKSLKKIKSKVDCNNLPLGDYEDLWDNLDTISRKILSKINSEKRNIKRNWIGYIISFILGMIATIITSYLLKNYFGW
ncbi:MAG: hypothetical protein WC494_03155 [Candidatus Pacearchaeota archaeon]